MHQLEEKLNDLLVNKVSAKLPEGGRKGLVTAMPWIALIFGVLGVFAAFGLLGTISLVSGLVGVADLAVGYGYYGYTALAMPMLWLSLILLGAESVMFLMAFSPLKAHKKRGWDLVFWVSLLNIVYSVASLLIQMNVFSLIFSLAVSLVSLWLLFQVRSYYTGASAAKAAKK